MNIALEKTEEYVNGQKRRTYGDAFVRGNNGKPPPFFPPNTFFEEVTHAKTLRRLAVMYISADS